MGLTLLGAIIIGVIAGLCKSEVEAWIPRFASWVRAIAARRLPSYHQERYLEEWQANLDELPGPLSKLGCAFGFCIAALRIALVDKARHLGWEFVGWGVNILLTAAGGARRLAVGLFRLERPRLKTGGVAVFCIVLAVGLCFTTLKFSMWRINHFSSGDEEHKENMRKEVRRIRSEAIANFENMRSETVSAGGPWG